MEVAEVEGGGGAVAQAGDLYQMNEMEKNEDREKMEEKIECGDDDIKTKDLHHVRCRAAWPEAWHHGLGKHQGLERGHRH